MKLNLKENDCEYGSYLHVLRQQLQSDYHIILQQVKHLFHVQLHYLPLQVQMIDTHEMP